MITPEQLAAANTENAHQTALFAWAATRQDLPLQWMFAIPNGGKRDMREAARLKAAGVKKGVFDVFLPVAILPYSGLFLEMKKPGEKLNKNGGLSEEQLKFRENVGNQTYATIACYSWIEARDAILFYLGKE